MMLNLGRGRVAQLRPPHNSVHGLEMGFWGIFLLAHGPRGLLGWRGQWLWVVGPRS